MDNLQKSYKDLVAKIITDIKNTQKTIFAGANKDLLGLYYRIGEHIDKNAVYGNKFIDNLSMDLKVSFPNSKGFSSRNLRDMHKYYQICISDPIWQTASAKLPWSHLTLIFHKIEDKNTRLWYINETAKAGWSYDTLALQIKTDVYSRQVLNEKINNYEIALPENTGKIANELMKDPYILNLASLDADFIERELENKMVEQIKTVLIELGTGFSFVGSEYKVTLSDKDYYIDLLFYHTILSSLSQEESRSISENTKWGKRRLMSEGKVSLAYSTFLGYEKGEDGKLKINKEEAKTVKLIYNLFLKGLSYYQIKKELEKKNLKTPFGNLRWHQSTVKSILTNEKYKGDALLQKGYTVDFLTKKQKKNEGEVQQYYIEGDHEGIVTKAMFDAVKTEIAERGDRITKYAGTNIITAKLVCGDCGGTLRRKLYHSNDKYRGFRYRCVNRCEGTKECHMRIVRDEDVKEAFVKEVNNVIKNKKRVIDELRKMIDMIDVRSEREKLEEIKDKIKKINIEVERLNKEASEGKRIATIEAGGVDNYKTKYDALETAYYNYKNEAEAIEYKIQDMDLRKMKLETTLRAYKHSKIISEFDADIWNGLLDKCIVLKNGYEFVWRK